VNNGQGGKNLLIFHGSMAGLFVVFFTSGFVYGFEGIGIVFYSRLIVIISGIPLGKEVLNFALQ
jgi:hypothetical protein